MLPHYLVKVKCSTVQRFIHTRMLYSWTFKFHKVVRQHNLGAVEDFILPYSAVYLRIQKWKNYWNPSTFAKVIVKIKVAPILMAHGVSTLRWLPNYSGRVGVPIKDIFGPHLFEKWQLLISKTVFQIGWIIGNKCYVAVVAEHRTRM